jgi:3-hydroxyisobutyrate dehydrogenase-like beta-hydroxyacid dehydrogenase
MRLATIGGGNAGKAMAAEAVKSGFKLVGPTGANERVAS